MRLFQDRTHNKHGVVLLVRVRWLLVVLAVVVVEINSYELRRQQRPNRHFSSCCCWVKPPPSARFDLEAIEAFEESLLALDELKGSRPLGNEILFDDDDDVSTSSNNNVKLCTVPVELDQKRIDAAVTAVLAQADDETTMFSRSFCGTLVTEGRVCVDEQVVHRKSFLVRTGQILKVQLPTLADKVVNITAQNLPLDILFEDAHLIVLNKAAGMVVHPATGNWDGTVTNALAYYLKYDSPYGGGENFLAQRTVDSTNNSVVAAVDDNDDSNNGLSSLLSLRPGIVHRLDKGTTGVLVVAKTGTALAALSEQFASRQVKKTYLAVTVGNPGQHVVIDKPIGRHPIYRQRMRVVPDPHQKDSSGMTPQDRKRMMIQNKDNILTTSTTGTLSQSGRRALSLVDTIAFDGKLALVQVRIETGRTHQIRVHLQDRHTPIYGDDIYGLTDWNKRLSKTHAVERPLLHAYKLQLQHPVTGATMTFQAPLANDMRKIAKAIYPQGEEEMPLAFGTTAIMAENYKKVSE